MPHSRRRVSQISPIVHRTRSASRIGGKRFASPRAASRTAASARVGLLGVPLGAHAGGPLELPALGARVEAMQLDLFRRSFRVAVDTDDHALAALDLLLPFERGLLDLVLHEASLDRLDRAAELVDAGRSAPTRAPRARLSALR